MVGKRMQKEYFVDLGIPVPARECTGCKLEVLCVCLRAGVGQPRD